MQACGRVVHAQASRGEFLTKYLGHPCQGAGLVARCLDDAHRSPIVAEAELDAFARQRQRFEQVVDMREFRALGAEEFPSRRHVVEKIAYLDAGALRVLRRPCLAQLATVHFQPEGGVGATLAGRQRHPGHRRHRRQCFAAEAHAGHVLEVVETADLAGGVRGHGKLEFVVGDPAAVIAHADKLGATLLDVDLDAQGAGVKAVLDQLLDHRRGALDDFAGGDLVDQFRGKRANGCHRRRIARPSG